MQESVDIDAVVRYLVDFWKKIVPNAVEYFHRQFGFSLSPSRRFNRLFLCQMADADISSGNIGHLFARRWIFADDMLEEVPLRFAYKEMIETDESGDLFLSPAYFFGCDAGTILLSERYGSSLIHRRLGQIVSNVHPLQIEWETLWTGGPNISGPSVGDYYLKLKKLRGDA